MRGPIGTPNGLLLWIPSTPPFFFSFKTKSFWCLSVSASSIIKCKLEEKTKNLPYKICWSSLPMKTKTPERPWEVCRGLSVQTDISDLSTVPHQYLFPYLFPYLFILRQSLVLHSYRKPWICDPSENRRGCLPVILSNLGNCTEED